MAAYDVLRVFRGLVRHKDFFVGVEDFCYWVTVGALSFRFLYQENDGTIRWFAIAGIGLGMLVFSLGISRLTVPAAIWLLRKLLWVIVRPIHLIVTKIRKSLQND